jgi:branched-chain amino acid transport system ATP-binding protein
MGAPAPNLMRAENAERSAGPGGDAGPVLEATGIDVAFKGVQALRGVDLEVIAGSVLGLLGPNGAGKSTLLAVLSGLQRPDAGTVHFRGEDVTHQPAHVRARRGLARTFQHPELFNDLTVRDHLVLADRLHRAPNRVWTDLVTLRALRGDSAAETAELDRLVELLGIEEIIDRPVAGLPLGSTRLVEVGRALATAPRALLLDEPFSGLDNVESARLSQALVRTVESSGVALVLVEHDVDMVLSMSDRVQVLDFGRTLAIGGPQAIRHDPAVRAAYLGEEESRPTVDVQTVDLQTLAGDSSAETPKPLGPTLLELRDVSASYGRARALESVSLSVPTGSVMAVLGANGAGKSTLARVVCGLVPPSAGQVEFDGQNVTGVSSHRRRRLGIAYLPEGRAVFPSLSVVDNLRMAVGTLPRGERDEAVARAMDTFPILGSRAKQAAGYLSGGEQQMLSLARVLAVDPKLVIADEMSLGLAPKIVDEVYDGVRQAVDRGVTVLLIEQFLHLALGLADNCCILRRGQVAWSGTARDAADGALDHYLGDGDLH